MPKKIQYLDEQNLSFLFGMESRGDFFEVILTDLVKRYDLDSCESVIKVIAAEANDEDYKKYCSIICEVLFKKKWTGSLRKIADMILRLTSSSELGLSVLNNVLSSSIKNNNEIYAIRSIDRMLENDAGLSVILKTISSHGDYPIALKLLYGLDSNRIINVTTRFSLLSMHIRSSTVSGWNEGLIKILLNEELINFIVKKSEESEDFIDFLADSAKKHCYLILDTFQNTLIGKYKDYWNILRNQNNAPTTLIHIAIEGLPDPINHNLNRTVSILINSGQDINAYDGAGYTPLHLAVLRRNVDLVSSLINHGANPSLLYKGSFLNYLGKTPKQIAEYEGDFSSYALLASYERRLIILNLLKKNI
jgi:hypothetical protein